MIPLLKSFALSIAVRSVAFACIAMLCQLAHADCYFDPFTGRQICTEPQRGREAYSGSARLLGPNYPVAEGTSPSVDSSAHCRITVGDGSMGSGTLVACDKAIGLVLTCSHLFDQSTGRIVVRFPSGVRYAAQLIDRDRGHDLAAIAIRRPNVKPLVMSDQDQGGALRACGFGSNGDFRCVEGSVTGQATAAGAVYPSSTIRGAVRPGDSGGGVMDAAGQLVGVVWGQRDGLTYATCGRPVREFLDRVLRRYRTPVANAAPSPDAVGQPRIDLPAWTSEIEARVRALDEKKQDKGDYLQAGDLNGYLRASEAPNIDETQFARKAEVSSRLDALSTHFKSIRARVDSVAQHVEQVAASKGGFFHGLSFGKLVVGALGLSGPLAAAVVVAGGLAGRRLKRAKDRGSRSEMIRTHESPINDRVAPIAVDSPPLPQRTVPETHYVPFEKDSFSKAHQWASEQVARKYPGATEVLQAQDSLIKQFIAAH